LADVETVLDFALALESEGLAETGEYVIISYDKDEVYDPVWFSQFCNEGSKLHPLSSSIASSITCRSIFFLTPMTPQNQTFNQEVLKRSSAEPFYSPINAAIQQNMSLPYAAHAYDAVQVLATALTLAYEVDPDANGTSIMQQVFNKPYNSK